MPRQYELDTDYKIGRLSNRLAPLRLMGIATPDQAIMQPASVYYTRADMSRVGDGYASCSLVWDMMSIERLATLLAFLDGKESNVVYIRTDLRDGLKPKAHDAFATYKATMWKPILSGQEGTPVARTPYVIQTVQIKFMNLEKVA